MNHSFVIWLDGWGGHFPFHPREVGVVMRRELGDFWGGVFGRCLKKVMVMWVKDW